MLFVSVIGTLMVWCLIAGVISKIFRQRMSLPSHWVLGCLLITASFAVSRVAEVVGFNVTSSTVELVTEMGISVLFIFLLLWGTLSLATKLSSVTKLGLTTAVSLLPVAFLLVASFSQTEREKWSDSIYHDNGAGLLSELFD